MAILDKIGRKWEIGTNLEEASNTSLGRDTGEQKPNGQECSQEIATEADTMSNTYLLIHTAA